MQVGRDDVAFAGAEKVEDAQEFPTSSKTPDENVKQTNIDEGKFEAEEHVREASLASGVGCADDAQTKQERVSEAGVESVHADSDQCEQLSSNSHSSLAHVEREYARASSPPPDPSSKAEPPSRATDPPPRDAESDEAANSTTVASSQAAEHCEQAQCDPTDVKTSPQKEEAAPAANKLDLPDAQEQTEFSRNANANPAELTADFSSKRIVSKYFSTELHVDVTDMSQNEAAAVVTSSAAGSNEVTSVSCSAAAESSCIEANEDKYEQILKKTLKHCDSSLADDVIDRNRKLQTQHSYEAAMQRAFAASTSSDVTEADDVTPHLQSVDDFRSDVRMARQEDGRDAIERTTTIVAGNRESTDELIKRILAESRGDVVTSSTQRASRTDDVRRREYRHDMSDDVISRSSRRLRNDEEELAVNTREEANAHRRGMYDEDDAPLAARGGAYETASPRSRAQMELSPRYRSGAMQRQYALYEEQAESFRSAGSRYHQDDDDDDDVRMRRRRDVDEDVVFADEEFIPQKAVDTDEVRT